MKDTHGTNHTPKRKKAGKAQGLTAGANVKSPKRKRSLKLVISHSVAELKRLRSGS